MKDKAKENASGGAIAVMPVAVWAAQKYGIPVEVVATVITWGAVWLRSLVK